jgi:Na+-translocating ferredoxin:NAD+ oxidoreductase subunit G
MRDNIYLRLGVPTLLICVVAAAGLALTYAVTKGPIAAQAVEAEARSLTSVLPDAKTFEKVTDAALIAKAQTAAGDVTVDGIARALDGAGATVGLGLLVGSRGYGGPIRLAVGVDRNGKVVGVNVVSMNETPGLGSKVVDDKTFLPRFTGLSSADEARKVDTITGATKSSRGVRKGVEAALAAFVAIGGVEGVSAK